MGGVLIRAALPRELPAIGELRVAAYRADGYLVPPSAYAEELRLLGADGRGEVLAAVTDGRIAGTVMLCAWPDEAEIARSPGEAEIRALAVAPEARGRGIGRALLAAAVDLAAGRDVRRLLLLTRPEMQAAQRLYLDAGFRRLPELDAMPVPGLVLLAYGLPLDGGPTR